MPFQSSSGTNTLDLPASAAPMTDIACHAHDQNNFLQVAFCLVETLRARLLHDAIGSRKLRELHQALESLERMNRAVLDAFHAAREGPPSGAITPDEVIERTVVLARSLAPWDVRIRLSLGATGAAMSIPEIHLQQVVFNLLKNGLEAAPETNGLVVLESSIQFCRGRNSALDGRKVLRITITDNGPGIPEEVRARSFECGSTSKPEGHGLGLHHARRILGLYEGSLFFYSSHVFGTRATVLWPLDAGG